MKKSSPNIYTVALMLFIILILGVSCEKENLNGMRQASFNTPFDLQLSEKILVTSDDRQLKVELRSLNDYRCWDNPYESTGIATARVFLSDHAHHAEAETNFCIGMCNKTSKTSDTVSLTIDKKQYSVILKKIIGSQDKKAELQINMN